MRGTPVFLVLIVSLAALSAEPARALDGRFRPLAFRVGQSSLIQPDGASFSGYLAWSPRFEHHAGWALLAELGASPVMVRPDLALGRYEKALKIGFESRLLLLRDLSPDWRVEAGATYGNPAAPGAGLFPGAAAGAAFRRPGPLWDSLIASYSAVFLSGQLTHQLRVGIELTLGSIGTGGDVPDPDPSPGDDLRHLPDMARGGYTK